MNILENTVIVTYPNYEFKLEYRIDKEGNVYSPYKNWNKLSLQKIKKGYLRVNLRTIDGNDKDYFRIRDIPPDSGRMFQGRGAASFHSVES